MKPYAIVIDLDGTLVDSSHREPYDYEKIMDDKVIMPVADIMGGNYLNIFSQIRNFVEEFKKEWNFYFLF